MTSLIDASRAVAADAHEVARPRRVDGDATRASTVLGLCPDPLAYALESGLTGPAPGSRTVAVGWEQRVPLPASVLVAVSSRSGSALALVFRTEFVDVTTGRVVGVAECSVVTDEDRAR